MMVRGDEEQGNMAGEAKGELSKGVSSIILYVGLQLSR